MITQTNLPGLPPRGTLRTLWTKIAGARIAERQQQEEAKRPKVLKEAKPQVSPEEIKKQKKERLLTELQGFLLITDRSDNEIRTETKRLEKAFIASGFYHNSEGNLDVNLEKAYKATKDKNLKEMILKMFLVIDNGYSDFLSVRLDPKHEDHKFAKRFFKDLSKDQIKDYVSHIYLPNENDLNALLEYDMGFAIETISKYGTKPDKYENKRLLLLLIQKLAPLDIDVSIVCKLFESDVYDNSDWIRNEAGDILRTRYPEFASGYFKQIAQNKELSKEKGAFSLRIAGIRHYALAKRENATADLKAIVLAEENIDLIDKTLPILLSDEMCGIKGKESVTQIIEERQSRKEPPLELYWLARDGFILNGSKLQEIDGYHDILGTVFSKVVLTKQLLCDLNKIEIDRARTFVFLPIRKVPTRGDTTDCLVDRIGIEKLEDWALNTDSESLRKNAFTLLARCSGEQLMQATRLASKIGMNVA